MTTILFPQSAQPSEAQSAPCPPYLIHSESNSSGESACADSSGQQDDKYCPARVVYRGMPTDRVSDIGQRFAGQGERSAGGRLVPPRQAE